LVEFALVLPVFLLLLFSVIDGGRFIYLSSTLSQAAREGARLGAVEAGWMGSSDAACNQSGGPVCPANLTALRADVLTAANRMMAPFGSITSAKLYTSCDASGAAPSTANWTTQTCVNNAPNNVISVRVEMTFVPITPILGQMLALPISGSSTMVIN
jgi:Flp pilus assembly protein TadG